MNLIRIAEGAKNVLVGKNKDLREFRTDNACRNCAIAHDKGNYTGYCRKDEDGCGCNVAMKTSIAKKDTVCPKGIWAGRWLNITKLAETNKLRGFVTRKPLQVGFILDLQVNGEVTAREIKQ